MDKVKERHYRGTEEDSRKGKEERGKRTERKAEVALKCQRHLVSWPQLHAYYTWNELHSYSEIWIGLWGQLKWEKRDFQGGSRKRWREMRLRFLRNTAQGREFESFLYSQLHCPLYLEKRDQTRNLFSNKTGTQKTMLKSHKKHCGNFLQYQPLNSVL